MLVSPVGLSALGVGGGGDGCGGNGGWGGMSAAPHCLSAPLSLPPSSPSFLSSSLCLPHNSILCRV